MKYSKKKKKKNACTHYFKLISQTPCHILVVRRLTTKRISHFSLLPVFLKHMMIFSRFQHIPFCFNLNIHLFYHTFQKLLRYQEIPETYYFKSICQAPCYMLVVCRWFYNFAMFFYLFTLVWYSIGIFPILVQIFLVVDKL